MKNLLLVLATIFYLCNSIYSQSKYKISFEKKEDRNDSIKRGDYTWKLNISASDNTSDEVKNNIVEVVIDKSSTLPSESYDTYFTINGKQIKDLAESNNLIVVVKKDNESFKQVKPLKLVLNISVKKKDGDNWIEDNANNEGKIKTITLIVMPAEEQIISYKFLGYLGTNFDLVDGVQAKNLFFATNIFIPETRHWGFNLGLYGNRTMTKTDTSKQTSFESRIVKINNDSIARYFDTAMKVTTRVSDNIGINFMPLYALNFSFLEEGPLKLYYAPQFEFIWRRTTIENAYLNNNTTRIDSMKSRFPSNTAFPLITPTSTKVNFNVYDAYLGLFGLLLRYETDEISVRVNSSVGINLNYTPIGSLSNNSNSGGSNTVYPTYNKERRFFYFGRLWITEPTTGLTLGAEVSNYLGKRKINGVDVSNAQPYYNVTLSKAFNLKNLVSILKPITNR